MVRTFGRTANNGRAKALRWIASAKDDLSAVPTEVRRAVGYALFAAQ